MIIRIVSDLHLTDRFDEKKSFFLRSIFENCDQLIVNGDFWSAYSCSFDSFVNSKWNKLFELMKSKKTTYLYGNHDREEWLDTRIKEFCHEARHFKKLEINGTNYHIEHGHLFFKRQSISNKTFMEWERKLHVDERIRYPAEDYLYNKFGDRLVNRLLLSLNRQLKNKTKKSEVLVTGHTHVPELDLNNKFANTGFINYGFGWCLDIDNSGCKLKSFRY